MGREASLPGTFLVVVDAGADLNTARPAGAGGVYWKFDNGTAVGVAGANIANGVTGDLYHVAGAATIEAIS